MKSKKLCKVISMLMTFVMMVGLFMPVIDVSAETNVVIDEKNFPDSIFRDDVQKYDSSNDGVLDNEELSKIVWIDMGGLGIKSLKGIEYFYNLEELYCGNTQVTELDLSSNTKLTYLGVKEYQLKSLKVSQDADFKIGYLKTNPIHIIRRSDNSSFDLKEYFPEIEGINIVNMQGANNEGTIISDFKFGNIITYDYLTGSNDEDLKVIHAQFTVEEFVEATDLQMNFNSIKIEVGSKFQLKVTMNPVNSDNTVTWQSDNENIATVDEKGVVCAKAFGSANVIAKTDNGLEAKCFINVTSDPTGITLDCIEKVIPRGETFQLNATVYPIGVDSQITWSVEDSNIVTVGQNGEVYAKDYGYTYVHATTKNGLQAQCKVRVAHNQIKLTATPIDYNRVKITWDCQENIELYEYQFNLFIYRAEEEDGEYKLIKSTQEPMGETESVMLETGKTYYYKARAFIRRPTWYDWFIESKIISATPILAAPVLKSVEQDTYSSLQISWEKSNGTSFYQVYKSDEKNGEYELVGEYDENTFSAISRSLTTEKTYYYKVRGYRSINGEAIFSEFSNIVSGATKLDAPKLKSVTQNTYNSLRINWEESAGTDYYQVYRSTFKFGEYALLGVYDENTFSSISKSLATGSTYYYKVRGYRWVNDERVFSEFSNIVSGTPKLAAPLLKSVGQNTYNSLKINWEESAGTNFYQVYRATSKTGRYSLLGVYDENTFSSVSRSLATGKTYYYKVRGYRWVNGKRVFSEFSNIVTGVPKLPAPKLKSVGQNTYNSLKINWEKSKGTNFYQVYRSTSKNGKYALLGVYDENTTSSISKSLVKGKTYYYKVRGYRWVNGERIYSKFSNIISRKV